MSKRLPSPAMVIACLALFVAMGGTGYAATQLASGEGQATISKKAKRGPRGKRGATGPTGPTGPAGAKGATGATGAPGLSALETVTESEGSNSESRKTVEVECPAGKKVVGTGFDIDGASAGSAPNETKEATIDEVDIAPDLSGVRFEAYEQKGGTAGSWTLSGTIICAKVG